MTKVIMGVGIPGSGKTTILKPFAESNAYTYISPDEIRKDMLGSESDQSGNKKIWKEAYKKVKDALQKGETVVFDATFADDFERRDFVEFVRLHGAREVEAVFFDVPLDVAHERNMMRERIVPKAAIDRMHVMLRKAPPEIYDGFNKIFTKEDFENETNFSYQASM